MILIAKDRGFTLAEIAIVILILGIMLSMGLKTAVANLDSAAYSETKSKQEQIKLALIGFLRTNGRLPCPDNKGGVAADGLEVNPCFAAATDGYGIVPYQTLQISRGTAQDGWGNYFSYKVANGTLGSRNWTSRVLVPVPLRTPFDIIELPAPTPALTIQELNAAGTALVTTTTTAVVVIISHGKNGFGAKTVELAVRIPTVGAGAGELLNANVPLGNATFVLRPVTDVVGFNGAYDDLVTFATPQELLQPLMSEKTIKNCAGYCLATPCALASCSATLIPVGNATIAACPCVTGESLPR